MKATITDTLIKRHRAAGVRVELWDGIVPSFYVQVRESGQASFYIRYVSPLTGQKRALRLGDTAIWPTDKARQLAREKLALVDQGRDPAEEREAQQHSPTLADVVKEHYLPHAQATKKSWKIDESLLRCHILPVLGERRLSAITTADVGALLNAMRHGGKADGHKGRSKIKQSKGDDYSPSTCNLAKFVLSHLYGLAIDTWKIPGITENPVEPIPDCIGDDRQVFLSPEEIQRLLDAGRPGSRRQNQHTLRIVMFLTMTGVRKSNVFRAEWSEFDLERGLWNLPATKTKQKKPQVIPLSQEALDLLEHLPSRETGERYLFANPQTGKPYQSIYYSWNSMRKRAGLSHVRMHDLRHTFASLLINGGASLFVVQAALGHSSPKTTMRYAHLAETTQRQAIQAAAAQVPYHCFLPTAAPIPASA